jgi:integrase
LQVKTAGEGMHCDGGGLYLQSDGGTRRSWIFRYIVAGRERQMGLGPIDIVPLAEARQVAAQCRRMRFEGKDPLDVRKAERTFAAVEAAKFMTFNQAAAAYIKAHRAEWKSPKHLQQWENSLAAYADPIFGKLPVAAIDVALILKCLEPIWSEKFETASRVRQRIESVLDWAKVKGLRSGENPARWAGHLEHSLHSKARKVKHHPALPYADIPAFMTKLRERDSVTRLAIEFTILTACRSGEVRWMPWSEVDLENKVWTIPADRMKGGREHKVPLSDPAIAVLARMFQVRQKGELVFTGIQGEGTMRKALGAMGYAGLTMHGFRSSFSDWVGDKTNHDSETREFALAHVKGDASEAAYRRSTSFDKRARLMTDWANYCNSAMVASIVLDEVQ